VRRRCVEGQKAGLVEAPSEMGQKLHNQNAKKNALIFMAPSCGIRELILRKSSNVSPTIYCECTLHSNFLPVTHALSCHGGEPNAARSEFIISVSSSASQWS